MHIMAADADSLALTHTDLIRSRRISDSVGHCRSWPALTRPGTARSRVVCLIWSGCWLQVIAAAEEAQEATGPVRDQRPLTLNHDDYLRCAAVPMQKGANYRNHEGVVVNARKDGSKRLGEYAPAGSVSL